MYLHNVEYNFVKVFIVNNKNFGAYKGFQINRFKSIHLFLCLELQTTANNVATRNISDSIGSCFPFELYKYSVQ